MKLAILGVLTACGGTYTGLLEPPDSDQGMQLAIKTSVLPGQEVTVCKNFAIPPGTFDIGRFEQAMSAASHHLLVYQTAIGADQVTDEVIAACDENQEQQNLRVGFIFGSQSAHFDYGLPEGIALSTSGGLAMQLEFHVLNATDQVLDAEAALNLWKAHEPITGDAGVLLLFHNEIDLMPQTKGTFRQRCPIAQDIQLASLIPHMHSRGTGEQISFDVGNGLQSLVDAQTWHADTVMFDPPVTIPAGATIDYQCEFNNTTDEFIQDGSSAAHNEMCVAGGLYYRPNGARMNLTDEVCFGKNIVHTGTQSCAQVRSCNDAVDWTKTVPGPINQFEMCMNSGCEPAVQAFFTWGNCATSKCHDECFVWSGADIIGSKLGSSACTACDQTNCTTEGNACAAQTCP